MTDLSDLIARVEAATGPDRELDDAIADAIFTGRHRCCIKGLSDESGGMWMFTYPDGSIGSSLRFTGSTDAALTLVPDGYAVDMTIGRYWPNRARVLHVYQDGDRWFHRGSDPAICANAATPALALCAAALKARNP